MIKIMHRLIIQTGRYKGRIRAAYIPSFFKGIMMKVPMILSFIVINFFMQGTMDRRKCLWVGIAMVVSVILQAVLEHVSNVLQSATGYMVFADMRMKLGDHLRKLPMGYFTEGNMGKISTVLSTDMVFIEENCMSVLAELVTFIISQGLMIVMMMVMDWRIGLVSLLVICIFILVGNLMLKNTLDHSAMKQECSEQLTDAVLDFVEGIGIIKSYNMLGEKSKSLSDNFAKSCDESIAFEKDYTPWSMTLNLVYGLGNAAVLATAVYLYHIGSISNIYLMGVMLFLFDMFVGVKAYYSQMARLTVTSACLDRIEEVFAEEEMEDMGRTSLPDASGAGRAASVPEIEYKDVTFGYNEKNVLHDISFEAAEGEMIALVGPSGGGKSTIANLLARFWDIKKGSIKVRGINVRDASMGSLMDNISMVFQRVYLFRDTIYNNIAIGRPNASRQEVEEAAKKARSYDFIMQLPEGFDTVIGEGGASLSGGEQQRISIARCILKDAPIVILDEATASVDADNERAIQEAISELCRNKTLLVIAHRLKTIRSADKILLISDGRIKESGTHDELMKMQGTYSNMVRLAG